MREYTYDELQQMQEKALERVRNMQKYSEEAVKGTVDASKSVQRPAPPEKPRPTSVEAVKKPQGRIKMPLNLPENKDLVYPSFQEYFAPETKKTQQLAAQKNKATLLDLKEPDEAMLFSLLLLLKSEGADEALMMALLYIMS